MTNANAIFGILGDLYAQAHSRLLGRTIVEGLFAFQQHGEITARLGVNKDGTLTVFTANKQLGIMVLQVLARGAAARIKKIPRLSQKQFEKLLSQDDFQSLVLACADMEPEPETPATVYVYKAPWSATSARGYMRNLATEHSHGEHTVTTGAEPLTRGHRLLAELESPECGCSEGRTRSALNAALGWKADKLNEAIEALEGPLSDAVELYVLTEKAPLGRIVLEGVAAVQEHASTSVLVGINQDASINLFCCDVVLGELVAKAVEHMKEPPHLGQVESVDADTFSTMVWDEHIRDVLNERDSEIEFDHEGHECIAAKGWPEPAAREFVGNLIDRLGYPWDEGDTVKAPPAPTEPIHTVAHIKPLTVKKQTALLAALREPDAVTSEARFLALLHTVMHWGTRRLDEAVAAVLVFKDAPVDEGKFYFCLEGQGSGDGSCRVDPRAPYRVLPPGSKVVCDECAVRTGRYESMEAFESARIGDDGFVKGHYEWARDCDVCGRSFVRPGNYMLVAAEGSN